MISFISITESKAIVKVSGTGVTETIVLADLVPLSGTQTATGPYKVSFLQASWGSVSTGSFAIKRDGVTIFAGSGSGSIDLERTMAADNTKEDKDFSVTTTGECYVYITLRKNAGYTNKLTPWRYGQYDDPTETGK